MPIHIPGVRKGSRIAKRDVVAILQLTAMVDLFTVLVVFLLQNYAVTNQVLPLDESLSLPQARSIKELKPSHVVVLSEDEVILDAENLGSIKKGTSEEQWVYSPLKERMIELIAESQDGKDSFIVAQLKRFKDDLDSENQDKIKNAPFRVTIQADENTEFVYIKRVMFTLTEAGIKEMNFAVVQKPNTPDES